MKKIVLLINFGLFLVSSVFSVCAKEMVYIYHRPESQNDVRYNYHWEVLKLALEKTQDRYGSYIMKPAESVMTERRQLEELKAQTAI